MSLRSIAAPVAHRLLPANVNPWVGRNLRLWRKHWRSERRRYLIRRFGALSSVDLVQACRNAGIRENGVLFVHCSYDHLRTYQGTPYELLSALRELAGPFGTLLMPSYSSNMSVIPC